MALDGGEVGRDGRKTLRGQAPGDEFDLARGGRAAVHEGIPSPRDPHTDGFSRHQPVVGDAGGAQGLDVEETADGLFGSAGKDRIGEAHAGCQGAEEVPVRAGLALGRDYRSGKLQVVMPVAPVEVEAFEAGGGGQHEVGVVHGVGVHLLVDHGEEVLPGKAGHDLRLLGAHGGGVRLVHEAPGLAAPRAR